MISIHSRIIIKMTLPMQWIISLQKLLLNINTLTSRCNLNYFYKSQEKKDNTKNLLYTCRQIVDNYNFDEFI